ncbi:MAG TPA: peptidoglycan DD-metalloendopeptidase family protein [Kofleriaceae bacterium]|nr:peptidoglycan DD-metalloendopeptidase family protein [Kofleriaceae bacterium]
MAITTRFTTLPLLALALAACAGEIDTEDLDPAGTLGDEQLSDDGPLPADESSDATTAGTEDSDTALVGIRFQLPFPCGQVWAGQTRTNHSPQNSIDFNRLNDLGDTVVAAAGGTVTRVENLGSVSYGRWIEISHGNGYTTRYAHLSSQTVSKGQVVRQGQKIGTVGSTGGSTGPHLHFEERRFGVAIRTSFNGIGALYFGTKNYTSQNSCGGGGGGVVGRVNTAGAPLTIRAGASTSTAAVGSVDDGATVTISCQKRGESITGTYGTSTLWDKIGAGFVADAYVSTGSDGQVAPTCP